jgi:hypothetical protein
VGDIIVKETDLGSMSTTPKETDGSLERRAASTLALEERKAEKNE